MPERIQRSRAKGWRMPEGTLYVGRPSRWGNPYRVGDVAYTGTMPFPLPTHSEVRNTPPIVAERCESVQQAVDWFRRWAEVMVERHPDWLDPLRGRDLACWCAPSEPCHADVLLELANR